MTQIYSENPRKIMQNKSILEKTLKIKLKRKGRVIEFEAEPEDEYIAIQVFDAIDLGFSVPDALSIKEEGINFEKISIKDTTRRKDIKRIRGRIIGLNGKSIETLEYLTNCLIKIHDSIVGIIGTPMNLRKADFAMKKLIRGSKHANVYAYLEKQEIEEKQNF